MNTWATYVRSVIGESKPHAVASRLGIHFTTIYAWLNGTRMPSAEHVITLCRAYNRNWGEALVAAGYLTEAEIDSPPPPVEDVDPSTLPIDVLLAEIGRRTGEAVA